MLIKDSRYHTDEVVFDRLLIEQCPADRVIYAVKSEPIINDATLADAREAGLTKMVKVITNGTATPGSLLRNCSDEFLQYLDRAEVVIAKGQANYETLSNTRRELFFLLKIKCPVIARDIGYSSGDFIINRNDYRPDQ